MAYINVDINETEIFINYLASLLSGKSSGRLL